MEIVSDVELARQLEDVGSARKVLQELLYHLCIVPRIDQVLTAVVTALGTVSLAG
jgi:hypothetical protein